MPLRHWAAMTLETSDHGPTPAALEAMATVQAIGPEAIPTLLRWIQPPWLNSILPSGAVHSFKALGWQAEGAIPELIRLFEKYKPPRSSDDYLAAWASAVESLSWLGPKALVFLLNAAKNADYLDVTRDIIHYLRNFGKDGAPAIPDLIEWTRHSDQWIRLNAVNALGWIAQDPPRVIPVLRACLKDTDPLVRRDAAHALGRFGQSARECAPDLIVMLDDPEWKAQTGPLFALARIGEPEQVVLPLLGQKLHGGNRIVRRCAALALGHIGGSKAFDVLIGAANEPDDSARSAVFQSMQRIDPLALEKSGKKYSDGCR